MELESLAVSTPQPARLGERLPLPPDEIHVWLARLDAADPVDILSPDECVRRDRFRFPEARERFAASRVLLRTILASYLPVPRGEIHFERADGGKPHCKSDPSLEFNLSHTGDRFALAVSRSREVGMDLERVDRRVDVPRVARRLFDAGEIASLLSLELTEQRAGFFRAWAAHEAIVKAMGSGMFAVSKDIIVEMDPRRPLSASTKLDFDGALGTVPVEAPYVAVVAARPGASRVQCLKVEARSEP